MAKKVSTNFSEKKERPKVRRKGIVAKTKASKIKTSKNYFKRSVGQGS